MPQLVASREPSRSQSYGSVQPQLGLGLGLGLGYLDLNLILEPRLSHIDPITARIRVRVRVRVRISASVALISIAIRCSASFASDLASISSSLLRAIASKLGLGLGL